MFKGLFCYRLCDQDNGDVLAGGVILKGFLDCRQGGLCKAAGQARGEKGTCQGSKPDLLGKEGAKARHGRQHAGVDSGFAKGG